MPEWVGMIIKDRASACGWGWLIVGGGGVPVPRRGGGEVKWVKRKRKGGTEVKRRGKRKESSVGICYMQKQVRSVAHSLVNLARFLFMYRISYVTCSWRSLHHRVCRPCSWRCAGDP